MKASEMTWNGDRVPPRPTAPRTRTISERTTASHRAPLRYVRSAVADAVVPDRWGVGFGDRVPDRGAAR